MNPMQQQKLITDMIMQCECRENKFPLIDDKGIFNVPVLNKNGNVERYEQKPIPDKDFRGLVLDISDPDNVTVWRYYKNGKTKEVASRV